MVKKIEKGGFGCDEIIREVAAVVLAGIEEDSHCMSVNLLRMVYG